MFIDGDFDRVSSETIDSIYENDLPKPGNLGVFQHFLKSRAVVVRTGHRSIDISIYNFKIVLFGKFVADTKLSFNGLFRLPFAGIAGINDCRFHRYICDSPFRYLVLYFKRSTTAKKSVRG